MGKRNFLRLSGSKKLDGPGWQSERLEVGWFEENGAMSARRDGHGAISFGWGSVFRSGLGSALGSLVWLGAQVAAGPALNAQVKAAAVPDAQVEASVLRSLAAAPGLADQAISTTVVYGVVTLSGNVKDETTQTLAEDAVARTAGVKKVVDELTVGVAGQVSIAAGQSGAGAEEEGSNPRLQSDGTMAPAEGQARGGRQGTIGEPPASSGPAPAGQPSYGSQSVPTENEGRQQPSGAPVERPATPPYGSTTPPYGSAGQPLPPGSGQPGSGRAGGYGQPPNQPPYGAAQGQDGDYGQPGGYGPPQGSRQPGGYGQGAGQAGGYGPSQRPLPNGGSYGPQYGPKAGQNLEPGGGQPGGVPVTIAAGTPLQVRLTQGIDTRQVQAGTRFVGIAANDVLASGYVAIPRGAQVEGTVIDVSRSGVLKGRSSLALELNQVALAGMVCPLRSTVWSLAGGDKTVRTVDTALGLGAVGAILGGVADGGAGAAIGAGVGGAAGLGASAASGSQPVFLPPEAVLTFRLTQPVRLATVSQAEMQRLGYGVPYGGPQQVRRRYPPAPYFYGPRYPYPRAYLYPRAYFYPRFPY